MKEFRIKKQDAEKNCRFEDLSELAYKNEEFATGSSYDGEWLSGRGMHGHGVYTFPNGVVYEGEFKDGSMHGKGKLMYLTEAGKIVMKGEWKDDIMIKRTIIFDDFVEYNKQDTRTGQHSWNYCKIPDRRYPVECKVGVQPAGNSFLTFNKPPRDIPEGFYDVGYGVYDPMSKIIYKYDLSVSIRRPSDLEHQWIIHNCRTNKSGPLVPRSDLYETFLEPAMQLAPEPRHRSVKDDRKRDLEKINTEGQFNLNVLPDDGPKTVRRTAFSSNTD
ncbi:hypothetical protein PYW07_003149 [Mythimna separata]|uniref:MORN repeat-containing protein 5 n=1 Tax=Mythimna separata TaxID=271217 RepID=A0AAD7YHF1_MYTSE|nr:hypothetical protein PYW07_003149 [Mythimna separata]